MLHKTMNFLALPLFFFWLAVLLLMASEFKKEMTRSNFTGALVQGLLFLSVLSLAGILDILTPFRHFAPYQES